MVERKSKNGKALHLQKLCDYYSNPIILEKDHRKSGLAAWAILLGGIIAYDTYAIRSQKIETLTRAFWRLTEEPIKKIIPITMWVGLTAHLLFEKEVRKKKFNNS